MLRLSQTSVSLYRVTGMYLILRRVVLLCVTLSMFVSFTILFTSIHYLYFILSLASIYADTLFSMVYSHVSLLFSFSSLEISVGVSMMWGAILFFEMKRWEKRASKMGHTQPISREDMYI